MVSAASGDGPRFVLRGGEQSGAQGRVERALDRRSGREVALKRPVDLQPAAVSDFLREAALLASVRHPALVAYVDHGLDPALGLFLATAWVEGGSLAERLRAGALPVDDVLLLGARLADALGALHAGGIRHGDVQPANVLLPGGRLEEATLIDLGLGTRGRPVLAASRGTPGFAAPEVALGGALDPASDVFSLAALLWTALVGRNPFEATDPSHTLARAALGVPSPLAALRLAVPAALAGLLEAMLDRAPGRRPGAVEARDRLLAIGTPASSRRPRPDAGPGLVWGRERELAWLEAAVGPGRIVLVRGPSGVGKSSLRQAWAGQARGRGLRLWEAEARRGDEPFAVARQLVGSGLGLGPGSPAPRPDQLEALAARWLPAAEAPLVAALLGDLWGLPSPPGADPLVALAQGNPALRTQLLEPSLVRLLGAAAREVTLVVDDLHAIDDRSRVVLERTAEQAHVSLVVLGQPWSTGDGPAPFADLVVDVLSLDGLEPAVARGLVASLWPAARPEQLDAVVAQADGLPGLLVELTSAHLVSPAAAAARLHELLAARCAGRSPLERRVLWAAALLGHRAPVAGLGALLPDVSPAVLDGALARLVSAGLLAREEPAAVLSFRPGSLREAALALAPPELLAGLQERALAWLRPRGGHEALLGWQAERDGRAGEAARRYAAGGRHALGLDFPSALRLAEQALACAPGGDAGALGCQLTALAWMGRWEQVEARGRPVMEREPAGSALWAVSAAARCFGSFEHGQPDAVRALLEPLCSVEPWPDALGLLVWALTIGAVALTHGACSPALAGRLERRLTGLLAGSSRPVLHGCAHRVRALIARSIEGDLGSALAAAEQALRLHHDDGALALETQARIQLGLTWLAAGGLDMALAHLHLGLQMAERSGADGPAAFARLGLVDALLTRGLPEAAMAEGLRALGRSGLHERPFLRGWALRSLAGVHLALGDPDEARRLTDEALTLLSPPCSERLAALVLRADALAALGRPDLSTDSAAEAVAILDAPDPLVLDEPAARACLAERRLAAGAPDEARSLLAAARSDLLARADRLPPALAPGFLARPASRRVLDQARYWLPPASAPLTSSSSSSPWAPGSPAAWSESPSGSPPAPAPRSASRSASR